MQFGSFRGTSTVQIINAVIRSVEVTGRECVADNAFNSASWNIIVGELQNIIEDCFYQRRIKRSANMGMEVEAIVPQRSALSPN